jgi:small-conductance mechanosensitive channel
MIVRFPRLGRVLACAMLLGLAGTSAPAAQPISTDAGAAAPAADTSSTKSAGEQPRPVAPHIDTAEITNRANRDVGADIATTIAGWQNGLERLENDLRGPRLRYSDLNALRDELQRVRSDIEEFANRLQPPFAAAKAQLDLLGQAPPAGQPAEAEPVARSRAELNHYVGLLAAGETAVNAANLRIDQLINTIQDIRRKNFTTNLFQPVPGIYSPQTWTRVADYAPAAASRLRDLVLDWWESVRDHDELLRIGLEALLLWLVLGIAAWHGVRWLRRCRLPGAAPPFWRRAASAAGVIALRTVPVVAPLLFLYAIVAETQSLPERIDRLFSAALQSVVVILGVNALAGTVLAPRAADWRLIPASDKSAGRIYGLILALAVIYGVTTLLYAVIRVVQAPFALTVAVAFPSTLLLAGTVVAILLSRLDAEGKDGMPSLRWLSALWIPSWVAIGAIVISALAGYLALSRFLAQQLVVTGSILALVYLLLLWVDGFTQGLGDGTAATGRWLEQRAGLAQQRRERLALPVGLLLKFLVLVLSVPLILLQWGYTRSDIHEWYRQLFFGFHIGNTQVSLAVLLASIIVFVLGYAAARLFQSWLDARVLKPAGISGGVRESIRTGEGYVGIAIAGVVAFSYAGFNLSSLAIVAGAFSVGIGFGLQSVVNNFVSGLILLAERPVKVGDLVVVGGEEGYVRRISVRSTEIETFERARVLIPNSYFTTEKVKNWTLRDNMRRLAIPVGVAHGCDARQVRKILLEVARSNPNIMLTPAPCVELEEFGADSLDFKLYAFVDDLTKVGSTSTELRLAILDAFREAGIAMPLRQTDVTLRNVDWLRAAAAEHVGGSSNGGRSEAGSSAARHVAEREGDRARTTARLQRRRGDLPA